MTSNNLKAANFKLIGNKFKLIGNKIENSASPFVHNEIFASKHLQSLNSYGLLNVEPENFEQVFAKLNQFKGVNITTPFKVRAFNLLNLKSETAHFFGCVNTIKTMTNGELKGFCTDGFGFLKSLQKFKTSFFKNVLIVGFGGASRVALKCLESKCANLFVAVRNLSKVVKTPRFKANLKFVNIENLNNGMLSQCDFELVVNATTCGNANNPNCAAIDLESLGKIDAAFDLIYYPTLTKFLKRAHELGAKTLNGIDMLVWQAIAAQQLWNGFRFKPQFVENLINRTRQFLERKLNSDA